MLTYKGYGIVAQYARYEIWEVDKDGEPTIDIVTYDNEFDGYQIWDLEKECQCVDLDTTYDSLEEAREALDNLVDEG